MIERFEPRTITTETTTTERDQIMPEANVSRTLFENQSTVNAFETLSVHPQTAVRNLNDD